MLKIAICDDMAHELEIVEKELEQFMNNLGYHINHEIQKYSSSTDLYYDILEGRTCDLYILDVEMPDLNGMELAGKINEAIPGAVIIFLTSYMDFARQGYRVRALRYIVKSEIEDELGEALTAVIEVLNPEKEHTVSISYYKNIIRVPYSEIIYVMKNKRQLDIITTKWDVMKDNRGLKEFLGALGDTRFIMIDKSCFINIAYASEISADEVITTAGVHLRYSRRMYAGIKSALTKRLNKYEE